MLTWWDRLYKALTVGLFWISSALFLAAGIQSCKLLEKAKIRACYVSEDGKQICVEFADGIRLWVRRDQAPEGLAPPAPTDEAPR